MPILKKKTPAATQAASSKPGDKLPGLTKENGGDGKVDPQPTPPKKGLFKKSDAEKQKKSSSFADRFNQTDASAGGGYVPPPAGTYECLIGEAQYEAEEGGKSNAYLECTIVNDGDIDGKVCRIYFNFTDDDGGEMNGMPYFKSALSMCGFDDELKDEDHLRDILAQIVDPPLYAMIDVVKKGKWTNVYLKSVFEDQDNNPEMPE